MSWGEDVYHTPDKFGLEIVADHDFSDGAYQFDLRVVWKTEDGKKIYTGRDSGCSCPSPFEDYKSVESLERLTSLAPLKEEYKDEVAKGSSYVNVEGWDVFRDKVAAALRQARA